MEVALTFGSVGDIVALCNLAVKLGRALGESSCGSAKEYRGLQRDLDIAVRVLSRVADAFSENDTYPQIADLHSLTDEAISDCESLILEFLDRWEEKYEDGLGARRPAKRAKKAWRSIEWSLRERERVQTLRDKLSQTVQTVTLLGNLAFHGSARVDRARIMAGTQEVNNHVSHVQRAIVRLETAVSDPVLKNPLDPTKDMPLFIEDPLGNSIEIPLDLVHSWEMFHTILAHQFENSRGYRGILGRRYALEEAHTARDVDRSLPLSVSVRRGMRIHMSIVFEYLLLPEMCPGSIRRYNLLKGTNLQLPDPVSGKLFQVQKKTRSGTGGFHTTGPRVTEHNGNDLESRTRPNTPSNFYRVRLIPSPLSGAMTALAEDFILKRRWSRPEFLRISLSAPETFRQWSDHMRYNEWT